MVKWCRANTETENEAVIKFQEKFSERIIVKNISEETFLNIIGPSSFLSNEMFKNWTFEVMKSKVKAASRFALNPYKIQQTSIERKDFIEPRAASVAVGAMNPQPFIQENQRGRSCSPWQVWDSA